MIFNLIIFFLLSFFLYKSYVEKKWALFSLTILLTAISIYFISYAAILRYSSTVEVVGTTNGMYSTSKSSLSIRYYFKYNNKTYNSSSSPKDVKIDNIKTHGGQYIVKVSTHFPFINEIDFSRPTSE